MLQLNRQDGMTDRMIATTTVTVERDGALCAQSQIEAVPMATDYLQSAPTRCGLYYYPLFICSI